jgi:DNA-binding CsgD family transcriptional regulator
MVRPWLRRSPAKPCDEGVGVERRAHVISRGVYSRQLIGRSRELAFLVERARDVRLRSGAIVVRGEAGIGKTRLIEDFAASVRSEGMPVGTGLAHEYGIGPYAAFTEALTAVGVLSLPPATEQGGDSKAAWYATVADALRGALGEGGAVVILEDLHWADPATIDLLRFCTSRLADVPVLFVATYRTDDVEPDALRARAIAALERDADVVTLNPLAPGQIEYLLSGILEDIGRGIRSEILAEIRDLADGRPFYAEELLRGVLERVEHDEHIEPSVPSSIRATVRERYGSLEPQAREILVHAAVIGRSFSASALARLLAIDVSAVYGPLRRARELQLVVEDASDDEGDRFAFRHALTREAVYSELLRAEARLIHGRVAALLAAAPNPNPAEVAEHAWRARDGENAAEWNERAGDGAASVYAYVEAARFYDRAFRSSADDVRRARAAECAAAAWYAAADPTNATRWYAEAADAFDRLGLVPRAARLRLRRARILFEAGSHAEGLAEADAVARGRYGEDAAVRFEADTMVSGLLVLRGQAAAALERLRSADRDAAPLDASITVRYSAAYAYALSFVGRASEARPYFEETVAGATTIGDTDLLYRTYNNWGSMETAYGKLSRARELYADALDMAHETRNVRHSVALVLNCTLSALLAGDLEAAASILGQENDDSLGFPAIHRWCLALRVRLATLLGEGSDDILADAVRAFEQAQREPDSTVSVVTTQTVGAALALHYGALGDVDEAARIVAVAAEALDGVDAPYWILDAASRYGDRPVRDRARRRLDELVGHDGAYPARGFRALAEAREAARRRDRDESTRHADAAVEAFRTAEWHLEEAFALEAAGRLADAVVLFRRAGARGEVRRLTDATPAERRRGDRTLTAREREIARLVVGGGATKAIAELLTVSERTVETHLASIYRKLGVSNRQELATLLSESAAPR